MLEISKKIIWNATMLAVNAPIIMYAGSSAKQEKVKNTKMNILFIAVDDLKPVLGCYGDTLIKTPNIDRLAKRSTVFLANYCQQAVSGPTRASLMTGRRPDYTKVWDLKTRMRDINPDILSMPQYLAEQGYQSLGIGKIYDVRCVDKYQDKPSWSIPYYKVEDQYYYKNIRPLSNYQNPETREKILKYRNDALKKGLSQSDANDYASQHVQPSVECLDLPDNAYQDGALLVKAKEILKVLSNDKKPFFFAVGFIKPHLPFVAPKKYWDLYKRDEMPLAPFQKHAKNSPELAYHYSHELRAYTDIPPLASFTDIKVNHISVPIEKQKELIHGYYACISYVDAQIGKLINTLDSLGLAKNTIIVLWGDHGWQLGDHDLWCKQTNFENATHAPLLISSPTLSPGKTKSMTEFVDIFPTICNLTGLQIPETLEGKSLVPLMTNPKANVKEYSVSQFPHDEKMGYSIRTKHYRLTYWMEIGFRSNQPFSNDLVIAKELYDYEKDPLETVNVIEDKKYSAVVKQMEEKMIEYFKSKENK